VKPNLLHICFVLDESGSMLGSYDDVLGGFKKLIEEQKNVEEGECVVSLYRFATEVKKDYIGLPIQEVSELVYSPSGLTAMNDGIGIAIDEIGKWLNDMNESERPSKNLIVIMTDGAENHSKKYSFERVKNMIKHQEEKYNWSFVYMGTDISSFDDVEALGITLRSASGRDNVMSNYTHINTYATAYRCSVSEVDRCASLANLNDKLASDTVEYQATLDTIL